MKRKIVNLCLIIIMMMVLFMLTGCNGNKENDLDSNKEYVKLNIPDNGSTLDHMGYMILDEDIIKYKTVKSEDTSKYKNTEGYSVSKEYYFEGIKEGHTEIWVVDMYPGRLQYIFKYKINVDSNLNAEVVDTSEQIFSNSKCESISVNTEENQISIADRNIAGIVNIWRWGDNINVVGIKEGNTAMTIKGKDGTEKKYTVKVDADLNVELEEK